MPRCYMIAVCQGSSRDQATENMTLFGLVTRVGFSQLPAQTPLELLSHWKYAAAELNAPFELRIVLLPPSGQPIIERAFLLPSRHPLEEVCIRRLPPLPTEGSYEVTLDWRRVGTDEWTRVPVFWPLHVELLGPERPDRPPKAGLN